MQKVKEATDAYTTLLKRASMGAVPSCELIALHGNRAAAHLAREQFSEAVDDCSEALIHIIGKYRSRIEAV